MEDEKEVGNVGSEYGSVRSEFETGDRNCEDTLAQKDDRNGKYK
jgi:hypothetical protein